MLFVIHCLDKPAHLQTRLANRPAHVQYMMGFKDRLRLLGPLLGGEDGATMVGSLIVIDLADRAAVEEFLAGDPYGQAGLFESVVVRGFKQVLPDVLP
ncbi:MAG: YciI family protein [Alphaproteobacteria bacterium]